MNASVRCEGGERVARAIVRARDSRGLALVPYITAGFPSRDAFGAILTRLNAAGDVVEVGVPFTDPMADGVTIQRASRVALEGGCTLDWIVAELGRLRGTLSAPVVLMTYLNPLLALLGRGRSGRLGGEALAGAGVSAVIVPDLPVEESGAIAGALRGHGVGLVQLVSPVTHPERAARLCADSDGFVYAVTVTGVTGASGGSGASGGAGGSKGEGGGTALIRMLDDLRAKSPVPVCAGFGIRSRAQCDSLKGHADGVIVGSAVIEALERGDDPGALVESMRPDFAG